MNKKKLTALIDRHLKGETTPEEGKLLEKFLESYQDENSEWNEEELGDREEMEEKIFSAIDNRITKKMVMRKRMMPWMKVAAVFLFAALLSSAIYFLIPTLSTQQKIPTITKTTLPGQRSKILFSDGTSINLNSESTLSFPKKFTGNFREVTLSGEAYFEVAHNEKMPFVVHTGNISTTVLGTKFNINAYPDDENISVSLVQGKIKVTDKESGTEEKETYLKPNLQLIHNKKSNSNVVNKFDALKAIGWKDNILIFDNTKLDIVFKRLGRAYGVKFILNEASQGNRKITTNFNDESIWSIIESIKFATGLNYKTKSKNNQLDTITFYNSKKE